ncbi:MAG: triose-phosphate isomerase [Oscillibacter sp.]|nr:triose-phosphate isomerase [Oscillibacter sp.]
MNRRYRKTVIAGNWKMNMTATETKQYAEELKKILPRVRWCDVVLCVPACNISVAMKAFRDTRVNIGAENVYYEEKGAFTGEVSAPMLKDLGVKYAIIGHSERRQSFGETDEAVNRKVHAALDAGLHPIICVGESERQRNTGITRELIAAQVKTALFGVAPELVHRCIVAYEPIWAIGTGRTATVEEAGEVCTHIRAVIRKLYNARIARSVTIQYGGSMTPENAGALIAHPDIDGGLIGGASLKPDKFLQIIIAANQLT